MVLYHDLKNLSIWVITPFNPYSPGDSDFVDHLDVMLRYLKLKLFTITIWTELFRHSIFHYPSLDFDLWKDHAQPQMVVIRPRRTQKSHEKKFARLYYSTELLLNPNFHSGHLLTKTIKLEFCSNELELWMFPWPKRWRSENYVEQNSNHTAIKIYFKVFLTRSNLLSNHGSIKSLSMSLHFCLKITCNFDALF